MLIYERYLALEIYKVNVGWETVVCHFHLTYGMIARVFNACSEYFVWSVL